MGNFQYSFLPFSSFSFCSKYCVSIFHNFKIFSPPTNNVMISLSLSFSPSLFISLSLYIYIYQIYTGWWWDRDMVFGFCNITVPNLLITLLFKHATLRNQNISHACLKVYRSGSTTISNITHTSNSAYYYLYRC